LKDNIFDLKIGKILLLKVCQENFIQLIVEIVLDSLGVSRVDIMVPFHDGILMHGIFVGFDPLDQFVLHHHIQDIVDCSCCYSRMGSSDIIDDLFSGRMIPI
jgi:hypothetical protein